MRATLVDRAEQHSHEGYAFLCTLLALGVDNVLFSVDWPYESNRIAADWLSHLQISEQDKQKICHLNAERVRHL